MCHDAICGTLLDSGGCGGAERPARSGGELPTFADGAMRLAFRLEIATSGWAGQEVAADEADCAYISAAARLTRLAPTSEIGEGGCVVGLLFRSQITALRIVNLETAVGKRII